MPITRARANNQIKQVPQSAIPVPSGSAASEQDDASVSGAPAPAPSSIPHTESAQQGSPMHSAHSRNSTRSSSTIKAQQLAAKVEHAKRIAKIEAERERAAAERERVAAEREKALADMELQAELAVIASCSSRSSRADDVESWLVSSHNSIVHPKLNTFPFDRDTREMGIDNECQPCESVARPPQYDAAPVKFEAAALSQARKPASRSVHEAAPPPTATVHRYSKPTRSVTDPPNITLHAPELGTHYDSQNCNLYKNKTRETVGTQDNFIMLANAIGDLANRKTRVSDIPRFDGRALDWLPFKRAFQQSRESFTPSDNIARIASALHGPAREAVAMLLVSAEDPEQIMRALENRFAQPEYIVLQQLALVRNLPRLATYEAPRELNIFACRVRNCVEVIRLLNQPEYLAAPELANTIVGKLTPLLRSRWADFASARVDFGKSKLENLADFLEYEASLQIKFGFIMSESTPVIKSQSQPVKTARDKIYAVATSSANDKSKSFYACQFCREHRHDVSDCEGFKSLSIDDRWQWVMENKVCRKCLKKGSHQYRHCKKRCTVESCPADNRHHTLLHRTVRSVTTAHVEIQEPSTSSTDEPTLDITSKDKCKSAVVAHSSAPFNTSYLKPLLKVIAVTVSGPQGSVDTYAFFDDGSSVTLQDQSVADSVGGVKGLNVS